MTKLHRVLLFGLALLFWLPAPAVAQEEIRFEPSLEAGLRLAGVTGQPVILVFGAVWCPACRKFKKDSLPDAGVREAATGFHWVSVDIDRNPSLAREFGVNATPWFCVLGADGEKVAELRGALPPLGFQAFLEDTKQRHDAGDQAFSSSVEGDDAAQLIWSPEGYRGLAICFSHVGYGPLQLPSQSPGQVLRLGLRPRTPSTLAKGQWELQWTETFANVFAFRENDFRLDYLTLNTTVAASYGLTDTVLVQASVRNLSRFDSILDPITDAFHDVLGLGDSGRDDFDSGENIIDLELQNGVEIEDGSSGTESTDLGISFQHNLTCGTETLPAFSYSLDAQVHLGGHADLEGKNPFSFGTSVAAARRVSDNWYLYGSLAYAWHGIDEARGLPLETRQASGLFAAEWRYAPRASWVVQYLVSEGVAVDRDPFNDPTHELNIGWKWEFSESSVLEIALVENVIEVDNSPDFGLHFGLLKRW